MTQSKSDAADVDFGPGGVLAGNALNRMLQQGRSYSGRERNCCFLNTNGNAQADGKFANISASSGLDMIDDGRCTGLVDWDLDGDVDLWLTNRTAPRMRLMLNQLYGGSQDSTNQFVGFQLTGGQPGTNRDAIGARVTLIVEANGEEKMLLKSLRAGEGFMSQGSKKLLFGLGEGEKAVKLIVRWPNKENSIEEFSVAEANQYFEVVEGSGQLKMLDLERQLTLKPGKPKTLPPVSQARLAFETLLPAPEIKYETFDGLTKTAYVGPGAKTLVVLWSGSCETCESELRDITARAEDIENARVRVLALSVDDLPEMDDAERARNLVAVIGFPFDHGFATRELIDSLQKSHDLLMALDSPLPIPNSFLVDEQGKLSVMYKGKMSIDQMLNDLRHSEGDLYKRYENSVVLPGSLLDHSEFKEYLNRRVAALHYSVAREFEDEGMIDRAIGQYEEVINLLPEKQFAPRKIARIYLEQGDFENAIAYFEKVLQREPENINAISQIANIYVTQRKFAEAQAKCEEAIAFEPDSAPLYYNLGNVLINQQNYDQGRQQYEKALELDPEYAESYFGLGMIAFFNEDFEAAEEQLNLAVEKKPELAEAHFQLGNVMANQKKFAEARSHYEKALQIRPNYAQAINNLREVIRLGESQ